MRRIVISVLVLAAALVPPAFFLEGGGGGAAAQSNGQSIEVDQGPPGPGLVRHPLFLRVLGHDASGVPLVTSPSPSGYVASQVQAYLGLTGDGSGQTIAIVDAYDDPNIASDLNVFNTTFGLPQACGTAGADPANCFTFAKATPQGLPRSNSGWALEISLDVEWAHAVAPKANIVLVEAASNSFTNLMSAVDWGAGQGASVISNSYGASEFSGEASYDSHCNLPAAVCTFSSGDGGNPGGYPAYSPYLVAVGGTTLGLTGTGTVTGETAWSGSGGGVSQYEPRPSYQAAVNSYSDRGMPDVSYDADPNTGFSVYDTVAYSGQTGWFTVGGTSAGAPQWAAILAVADQERAAASLGRLTGASFQADITLYGLLGNAALFDVTSGSNGSCGSICQAATGYDFVTGLGSPRHGIDSALSGGASSTPTSTPTPGPATATPTVSSTPTVTNTPGPTTPTPTNTPFCAPGQHKKGAC